MKVDLLLKGGRVIDPSHNINGLLDVAVRDGLIAAVGKDMEASADRLIDVTGCIVTPGLIDLHTHICWGFTDIGLVADEVCPSTGVTTIVDAGSSSWPSMGAFRCHIAEGSVTRALGFSNISSIGIPTAGTPEVESLKFVNVDRTVSCIAQNRDLMVGVKVRQGRHLIGDNGVEPTRLAVEAADQTGTPVMVHVGNTPGPLAEIIDILRPGDIITHAYHGHAHGILDDHRAIWTEVIEGRKRGIIMDVGHGAGSFKFDVAQAAFERGFFPDVISTDLYTSNINGPVYDLPTTISKMINLGMPLEEAIASVTSIPARVMGRSDLGHLAPGVVADIAVFELEEGEFEFRDCHRDVRIFPRRLVCDTTIRAGKVWYERGKAQE
jgi:dihydroorotase